MHAHTRMLVGRIHYLTVAVFILRTHVGRTFILTPPPPFEYIQTEKTLQCSTQSCSFKQKVTLKC